MLTLKNVFRFLNTVCKILPTLKPVPSPSAYRALSGGLLRASLLNYIVWLNVVEDYSLKLSFTFE